MAITVVSTSDTKESVAADAAKGAAQPVKVDETKSASEALEASDEITDESDTSENDAESADAESDDDQDESLEAKEDLKPKKNGAEKRIKKLVTERNTVREERDYWRQEALKRSGDTEKEPAAKTPPKQAASIEGKPTPDDFETHADYVDALADWKVEQKLKERDQREQETRVKTEYQKRTDSFRTQVKTFQETHDDFADVIEAVDDIPMSPIVQDIFLEAENGPELMYELAKDRKNYERICRMNAKDAAFAMGQFTARIAKQTEAKKPEVKKSNAPAPINPVGQRSNSSPKSIYDPAVANMSQRDYEKLRRAQMAQQD